MDFSNIMCNGYVPVRSGKRKFYEGDEMVRNSKFRKREEGDQPNMFSSNSATHPIYSKQSLRMMEKMKFDKSKGLGKSGQGRTDIVQISSQKGRRGLGLNMNELDAAALRWNKTETISLLEKVDWLESKSDDATRSWSKELLESWIKYGKRQRSIDGEDKFCDKQVLRRILECKSAFDKLDAKELRKARARSNLFESIKSNIFMNRAAVKMANLDSLFNYMFTEPKDRAGNSMVNDDEPLYFADVCAGPGGFSEYVLWRKKWRAKGFGFTLKGENDFKLHDFLAGTPETFNSYYGPKDNGDIFNLDNINGLEQYVLEQSNKRGVHFMMADGGFSVEGNENLQEVKSKQLYLCQILVALKVVRTGGHCVVKLFDLFTPFSVGLIYLVSKCFDKISICKPNSSRPANSERYLVCKWKKPDTDLICQYLYNVNEYLQMNADKDKDILELVPLEVLKEDSTFYEYICDSNNDLGACQVNGLQKIAAYAVNTRLVERRQDKIKKCCLELWKLDDQLRETVVKPQEQSITDLLAEWTKERLFLAAPEQDLNGCEFETIFPSIHGWHFVPVHNVENDGKNIRSLFIGRGGRDVRQYNTLSGGWGPLKNVPLELPARTLIYGEIVKELQGEGKSQSTIYAFHIIDGIILGGEDIRKLSLEERVSKCEVFAKALNKPCRTILNHDGTSTLTLPIRCKKPIPIADMNKFFEQLQSFKLKGGEVRLGYNLAESGRFYVPRGLLLLNETRDDFVKEFSNSGRRFYYFCKANKRPYFPEEMELANVASFKNTYIHRIVWKWLRPCQVYDENQMQAVGRDPKVVHRVDFQRFLLSKALK